MDDKGIFGGDPINDFVLLSVLNDDDEKIGGGGSPSGCSGGKFWLILGIIIFVLFMLFNGEP